MTGHRLTLVACTACWLAAAGVFAADAGPDVQITIDAARPGAEVNPHMYGIFFEEINHGGDGGLYAELIRNRSFEDANVPEGMELRDGFAVVEKCRDRIPWQGAKEPLPGWIAVARGGGRAALHRDATKPLKAAQTHGLRMEIERAGDGALAGAANTGYWGIATQQGAKYDLSLHVRAADGFRGTLRAALEDARGNPVSSTVAFSKLGAEWQKLEGTLQAGATRSDARLALYADAPGTLWLDVVSLFPQETFLRRKNGLRPDLAQMLKDLQPGFLRFPGGCITEGLTLEQGFQWKKTVGEIAERPGVWNSMWGYRRTDGLGYHEYLQLAEDIGATPIFCLNMGIACTIHSRGIECPPADVPRYLQDALDAIAYANDPSTTAFGALRAKHGHAQPFGMKYVNVGNELNCATYTERYSLFYRAIKAQFPAVQTIAYGAVGRPRAPVEMKDLHDYRNEDWFLKNVDRFDAYDRSGPKIACMEIAAHARPHHTLYNALLEAAYMLGLERNADVVRLVSYAPLFLNVNHPNAWKPDLIHFDNRRACGTPSYYAQQLFMHHRPDVVLPAAIAGRDAAGVYVIAGKDRTGGEVIVKLVNLTGRERSVEVLLIGDDARGAKGDEAPVKEIVLTSGDKLDTNTLEQPTKVAPVGRQFQARGAAVARQVPPYSLTVWRWPMQKGNP
jgi:alpha-L-arabinofuranosidase